MYKAISVVWIPLAFVFAGLNIQAGVCQSEDQEAGGYFSRGIALFAKGDIDKAITEFGLSLKLDKKNALVYYQRAKAYEHKKDFERAIADYTQAIQYNPSFAAAYYYRALLYQKNKRFDEALKDYTLVVEMDSASKDYRANACNNRGLIYYRKGEYLKATEDLTRAISLIPSLVNVYYNRGCVYVERKEYALAISDFNKELEMFPKSFGPLHYSHMLTEYQQKRYSQSWDEAMTLLRGGEHVSAGFLSELRDKRRGTYPVKVPHNNKSAQPASGVLRSG